MHHKNTNKGHMDKEKQYQMKATWFQIDQGRRGGNFNTEADFGGKTGEKLIVVLNKINKFQKYV